MQEQQVLNQEEYDEILPNVIKAFDAIYIGKIQSVSYTDIYNKVYRLCRKGMQAQVVDQLAKVSHQHFGGIFNTLDQQNLVASFVSAFHRCKKAIEKIMEILLYIQTNYYHEKKKEYASLADMLNLLMYQQLCKGQTILPQLSEKIAEARINKFDVNIKEILTMINSIDLMGEFFVKEFIPIYQPLLAHHYSKQSNKNFQELPQQQFFITSQKILDDERQWLKDNFGLMKNRKAINETLLSFYDVMVSRLKDRIYQQNPQSLFKDNTLALLQLLQQKGDQKQINDHNQWFVSEIKKRLSVLSKTNNTQFLQNCISLYQEVSQSLSGAKNFNIRYKTIFFFEDWINDEKLNFPKRLNYYIEERIIENRNTTDSINNFEVLFKFLKEKDLFRKLFIGDMITRIVSLEYRTELEDSLIDWMGQECGEDYVDKMRRVKLAKQEAEDSPHLEGFSALVFEDVVWNLDKCKYAAEVPQRLMNMAGNYFNTYEQTFKGRKIAIHATFGTASINIKFENCQQMFRVDTVSCALLLYLEDYNYSADIKDILKKSHYELEQVTGSIKQMETSGILKVSGLIDDPNACFTIKLNQEFNNRSTIEIDLVKKLTEKKLHYSAQEELKADRKVMVQALIVKVIKNLQTATKLQLFTSLKPMIEQRGFQFNENFVHKILLGCIDRGFLQDQGQETYTYIAS